MSRLHYGVIFLCQYFLNTFGQTPRPTFSQEQLEIFLSLNPCPLFGGTHCATACAQFIRHRWNVPLCYQGMECCIVINSTDQPLSTLPPTQNTTVNSRTDSTVPQSTQHPWTDSCGRVRPLSSRRKRIVGGTLAEPGSWPWLVGLRAFVGAHACSGALIARQWIVTAAHCFKFMSNPAAWRVRLGEYNLLRSDAGERQVPLERIIIHPDYRSQNTSNTSLYARYLHDIALIKISESAELEPICLPTNQDQERDDLSQPMNARNKRNHCNRVHRGSNRDLCWVAGWGATLDSTVTDQLLREVSGAIIDSQTCSNIWGDQLPDHMICFGNGTYGPCAGDSGGPLSCGSDLGRFVLQGVVSWGSEFCNVTGHPSVFTRVRPYVDWIRQHVEA